MPEFEKGKSIPKARANFLIRLGSVKQLSYYPHRTECVSNITHSNNTSQRHTVATIYSYTQLSLMQFCLRFRFTINLTYTSENTDLSRHIQLTDKNFPAFFNVVIPRDSSPDISNSHCSSVCSAGWPPAESAFRLQHGVRAFSS